MPQNPTTVNELRAQLDRFAKEGHGERFVILMHEEGHKYADDFYCHHDPTPPKLLHLDDEKEIIREVRLEDVEFLDNAPDPDCTCVMIRLA